MAYEENDPSRLKWALEDLGEITTVHWSGGDAIVSSDIIGRTRAAALFVIGAFEAAGLTKDEVAHLADDLTGVSETLHQLGKELEKIETIGSTKGHLINILTGLDEARDVVEALIPQID